MFENLRVHLNGIVQFCDGRLGDRTPEGWSRLRSHLQRAVTYAHCCVEGLSETLEPDGSSSFKQTTPTLGERFAPGLERPYAVEASAREAVRALHEWSFYQNLQRVGPDGALLPPSYAAPSEFVVLASLDATRIGRLIHAIPGHADLLRAHNPPPVAESAATVRHRQNSTRPGWIPLPNAVAKYKVAASSLHHWSEKDLRAHSRLIPGSRTKELAVEALEKLLREKGKL
ncbi:MAG: hypothetical protein EPO68_02590 [Planctomycetota bacterium]|nr:MAG: hypothetical protein EPO68_02590 [Planctomycetota bacterium]